MSDLAYWNSNTNYLLLVIDCFSKHAHIMPLKNKEGRTVAEAMEHALEASAATPSVLSSDHGKEFVSAEFY